MLTRSSARLLSLLAISALAALLTGCGMGHIATTESSAAFQGRVFGGQQPIGQSSITVWQAGTTGYGSTPTKLAVVTSDDNGNFSFPANAYTCPSPTTQVYITAANGNPSPGNANPYILLAAGLGNCANAQNQFVIINEVTTAATAFAMAQFFDATFNTNNFGTAPEDLDYLTLSNVNTIPMLVDLPSGTARPSSPGITRDDARLNTIANIIAACVNDSDPFVICREIFFCTTSPQGTSPSDTLQAAVGMALLPDQHVSDLFGLPTGTPPFVGLPSVPNDFSLTVAYTSPNFGLSINGAYPGGTSSNIDIDSNGRVFFPSDALGQAGLGYFDPSLGSFGNLQLSGLLTTPQYIAVDPANDIYETDLGSGNMAVITPDFSGVTSGAVAPDAASSSAIYAPGSEPPTGIGPAVVADTNTSGNSFMLATLPGLGTLTVGQLPAPATGVTLLLPNISSRSPDILAMTGSASTPCTLKAFSFDSDTNDYGPGQALISTTGSNCLGGGLAGYLIPPSGPRGSYVEVAIGVASTANQLCTTLSASNCFDGPYFNSPQGLALDGVGTDWVASSGDSSIVSLSTQTGIYVHPDTLPAPYGIAIDGSGNVWVSNAGCVTTTATPCTPGPFTLTELIGIAAPAITPLSAQSF